MAFSSHLTSKAHFAFRSEYVNPSYTLHHSEQGWEQAVKPVKSIFALLLYRLSSITT